MLITKKMELTVLSVTIFLLPLLSKYAVMAVIGMDIILFLLFRLSKRKNVAHNSKLKLRLEIFLLITAFSCVFAHNYIIALKETVEALFAFLCFLCIEYFCIRDNASADRIISAYLWSCVLISILYFAGIYFSLPSFKWVSNIELMKTENQMSFYIGGGCVFSIIRFIRGNRSIKSVLLFVLAFAVIILSERRGALVSIVFGVGVSLIALSAVKKNFKIIIAAGAILIILYFNIVGISNLAFVKYFDLQESFSNRERVGMWLGSLEMFMDYPLGVGKGNWSIVYFNEGYRRTVLDYIYPHPHNDYIQVMCETGILGIIAYLSIYVYVIKQLYRNYKAQKAGIYVEILSWFMYCISFLMFNQPLTNSKPFILLYCMFGIASAYIQNPVVKEQTS